METAAEGKGGLELFARPLLPCSEHTEGLHNDGVTREGVMYLARGGIAENKEKREENNDDNSKNFFLPNVMESNRHPPRRLMAELQIETLSTPCVRAFLYSWYAMLFLALALQSLVLLQWKMTNFCGATPESLRHIEKWNSPCVENFTYAAEVVDVSKHALNAGRFSSLATEEQRGGVGVENNTRTSISTVTEINTSTRRSVYNIRWIGSGHEYVLGVKLHRFVRIVLSMASPQDKLPPGLRWKRYKLSIALPVPSPPYNDGSALFFAGEENSGKDEILLQKNVSLYNVSIICYRSSTRCSSVGLPLNTAVYLNKSFVFTIFGIDEELGDLAAESAVGIVFQRSEYTIVTVVLRYTFLAFSVLHLFRFLYRKRYSKTLYEQYWVIFLHICLYLYLDPFFAVGIYEAYWKAFCYFFEFHFPNFFAAFLTCFIFALITATIGYTDNNTESESLGFIKRCEERKKGKMCSYDFSFFSVLPSDLYKTGLFGRSVVGGSSASLPQKEHQQQKKEETKKKGKTNKKGTKDEQEQEQLCGDKKCVSFHTESVVHPILAVSGGMPLAAKMTMSIYLFSFFFLKALQLYFEGWNWEGALLRGALPCTGIRYALYGLLLVSILLCCGLLLKLRYKLAERPYLATRPQQLACRVFIFIFTTALFYFVLQVILIVLLYPQTVEIVAYQPFIWLSSVIVSTFFVNYMTFVYTTTVASRRVPIRPENPLWRRVVWSSEWYRWLDLHGGILYIFYSEKQERYFNWLQKKNHMSAMKFKGGRTDVTKRVEYDTNDKTACHGVCGNSNSGSSLSEFSDGVERESDFLSQLSRDCGHVCNSKKEVNSAGYCKYCAVVDVPSGDERKAQNFLDGVDTHPYITPTTFIDRLEDVFVNPLQYFFLRRSTLFSFFNLETAIDCLNLSWEAYVKMEQPNMLVKCESRPESVFMISDKTPLCGPSSPASCLHSSRIMDYSNCNYTDEQVGNESIVCDKSNEQAPHGSDVVINKKIDGSVFFTEEAPSFVPSWSTSKICTEQYGYKKVAVFEGLDVQVVIAVMDNFFLFHRHKYPRLVIAFRGTDNLSNAREDLRLRKRTWREVDTLRHWGIRQKAKVHTGFLNIWISLKEKVLNTLTSYLNEHSEKIFGVFCTGHSLGGALACLCAYSVYKILCVIKYPLSEVTVYTFGQPPVGNKAFQSAYNKAVPRTFRVVNESDAVSFLSFGGCYVGIEVDIDRYGNCVCSPMFIERMFRPTTGRGFSVINHTLAAYALSLNAVAARDSENTCKVRCLEPYLRDREGENDVFLSKPSEV